MNEFTVNAWHDIIFHLDIDLVPTVLTTGRRRNRLGRVEYHNIMMKILSLGSDGRMTE